MLAAWIIAEVVRGKYGYLNNRHLAFHYALMLMCIATLTVTVIMQLINLS